MSFSLRSPGVQERLWRSPDTVSSQCQLALTLWPPTQVPTPAPPPDQSGLAHEEGYRHPVCMGPEATVLPHSPRRRHTWAISPGWRPFQVQQARRGLQDLCSPRDIPRMCAQNSVMACEHGGADKRARLLCDSSILHSGEAGAESNLEGAGLAGSWGRLPDPRGLLPAQSQAPPSPPDSHPPTLGTPLH